MLFERIEKQHGRILVFHALAYITAAKSGLSESELEDLISLDDKVLDDVYQYHVLQIISTIRRICFNFYFNNILYILIILASAHQTHSTIAMDKNS